MPGFVGPWELIIIAVVIVAIFGTSRLPQLGRQAGKATRKASREVREVKQALLADEQPTSEKNGTAAETNGDDPVTTEPKSMLRRLID